MAQEIKATKRSNNRGNRIGGNKLLFPFGRNAARGVPGGSREIGRRHRVQTQSAPEQPVEMPQAHAEPSGPSAIELVMLELQQAEADALAAEPHGKANAKGRRARNHTNQNLLNSRNRYKEKFQLKFFAISQRKVLTRLAVFAAVLGCGVLVFEGTSAVARAMKAKSAVLGATTAGLQSISEGQALASSQQYADSQNAFSLAEGYFLQGKVDLGSDDALVSAVIAVTPQGQDAKRILDAGTQLSQAGANIAKFEAATSGIKVTAAGFQAPNGLYQTLGSATGYVSQAQTEMQTASTELAAVNLSDVPQQYRSQLAAATQQTATYAQALTEAGQLLTLGQDFFGQGPKTVLVLFENNSELRPGGGFIGTYGIFDFNNGVITLQKISSIYDLDGQLTTKIAPPGEFHALTDSWGLRDSNWFADFRDSAQKASGFYELEGHETPDAVVAITPDVFEDILKITGPIPFPKYNVTLTADNFRSVVQVDTSEDYDKVNNTPKQMLADFEPLLLQKLSEGTASNNGTGKQLLAAVLDNLKRKNIMIYDRDDTVEQQLIAANWAGSLADTDKDYLEISAANLGGEKTDLNIQQTANLQSAVQPDGSIVDTLTYTRTHQNVLTDPKNISYVRFFVPSGSTLISATGFTPEPYYKSDGSAYASFEPLSAFTVDPELATIDASTTIDASSGTVMDSEDGKTTFGNWMETDEGQSQTVTISYKLPFAFDGKSQSLTLQKEPGATDVAFNYSFNAAPTASVLPKSVWYTPYNANDSDQGFSAAATLNTDQFFGVVFGTGN